MKPREEFEKDSGDCEPRDASFELIHNQRAIRTIEVSDQVMAPVRWWTWMLCARQRGQRFPLERARLQGLQPGGSGMENDHAYRPA